MLPGGRGLANLNVVNPQHTMPFLPTDSFLGQDKGGWPANLGSFLLGAVGPVNITSTNSALANIRVSNNGNMAIEDANPLTRQPKVCYLAMGIVNASNIVLAAQGSRFQLAADPAGPAQRSITIAGVNLIRVTPQNVINATAGLAMNAAQSCNALVQEVIGHAPNPQFLNPLAYPAHLMYEYHIARALLQVPPPLPAALPAPGPGVVAMAAGNPQVVQQTRAWNTHWAGVVAVDGNDVITLENYARNTEDALLGNDTRYYFQMYNTAPPLGGAGSWHNAWTTTPMQPIAPPPGAPPGGIHPAATHEPISPGARGFANPITIMVG